MRANGRARTAWNRLVEILAAFCHNSDRFHDLGRRASLEEITACASLDHFLQISRFLIKREPDDFQIGPQLAQTPRRLDSVHSRHGSVHQNHVGVSPGNGIDGGLAVFRLGHEKKIGFETENIAKRIPHHFVIVYNHDPNPGLFGFLFHSYLTSGIRTIRVVPSFGLDSTCNCPAILLSRSFIPTSPSRPRPSATWNFVATSKPRPSSSIIACTCSLVRLRTTLTCLAPECFATLLSASWITR